MADSRPRRPQTPPRACRPTTDAGWALKKCLTAACTSSAPRATLPRSVRPFTTESFPWAMPPTPCSATSLATPCATLDTPTSPGSAMRAATASCSSDSTTCRPATSPATRPSTTATTEPTVPSSNSRRASETSVSSAGPSDGATTSESSRTTAPPVKHGSPAFMPWATTATEPGCTCFSPPIRPR